MTLAERLTAFMDEHIYPNEATFHDQVADGDRWQPTAIVEDLKIKARAAGLWNLFLPEREYGAGLSNTEYAPLCEIMGRSARFAPEVFNCSAPDTGNMEVLVRYGSPEQRNRWLTPLLAGEIRSCFAMTEPDVASSDATNIKSSITRDGDQYVINGHKWWISGAGDPRCRIAIFMGKTDPHAARHQQQFERLGRSAELGQPEHAHDPEEAQHQARGPAECEQRRQDREKVDDRHWRDEVTQPRVAIFGESRVFDRDPRARDIFDEEDEPEAELDIVEQQLAAG